MSETGATDDTAIQLRSWSQRIGLSTSEPWDAISERRRDQWRRFADEIMADGRVIVPAALVPTADELAAMRWLDEYDGCDGPMAREHRKTVRAYLERQS